MFNYETGVLLTTEEQVFNIYENKGYNEAIEFCRYKLPKKDILKQIKHFIPALDILHNIDQHKNDLNFLPINQTIFKMKHQTGIQIEDWWQNHRDKTLYLHGKSGLGKTEALKTYLVSKSQSLKEFAFIRHPEQLKHYNLTTVQTALMDDLPVGKIFRGKPEEAIHFIDRRNPTTIRLLYKICTYGKNKNLVITSNLTWETQLDLMKVTDLKQRKALTNRVHIIKITKQFPFIIPTKETINTLKNNLDIYHPNWKKLEIKTEINIK